MKSKRIHLIYSIVLSVFIAIAGICLIIACVQLYDFKAGSFSRESVADAFRQIAIPVYLCLAAILGGIVLNLVIPVPEAKRPVAKQYRTILEKLQCKVDIAKCDPAICREIQKQRRLRKIHTVISYVLLGVLGTVGFDVCCIIIICYAKHYTNEMNEAVITAMTVFLPYLLIPFGYGVFTAYFKKHSLIKEIELLKQAIANGAQADAVPAAPKVKKETAVKVVRYAVLGIAVIMLVGGFLFGGTADVLAKAAAICTECVGLG